MRDYLFPPRPQPVIEAVGTTALYPVARIFCVGRNYVAHAAEMGGTVDRESPFYFTKSAFGLLPSGSVLPYPPGTRDLHHEVELVVALGRAAFRVGADQALQAVFGYGVGLDMTRRDLQAEAKDKRRPWDTGKDFEGSAVIGPLTPAAEVGAIGPQRIRLEVSGHLRQDAVLADMVWDVAGIIGHLSTLYHLGPGDIIMTGTPAGVGPVVAGDRVAASIEGLAPVDLVIGPGEAA